MKRSFSFIPQPFILIGCVLFLLGTDVASATTCTFSGNTTYCTDSTGKTTTYNQYGDNIYGSDGSSATIYHDPVYGMGTGQTSVSTAGVDMDSPEMKEAQANYERDCVTAGPTCTKAVASWLEALSKAPRIDTSSDAGDDDYSDYSNSNDEDLDEWTKKLLSDFGITNDSSQSGNLCVSGGILNSHPEGNVCICDSGYLQTKNNGCVRLSVESCQSAYGKGSVPTGTNDCGCATGYSLNSTRNGCLSNSATTDSVAPSYTVQSEAIFQNTSTNFEVKPEDILPLSETGNTNTEATLRECPSTQCSKVGSYPEGTMVEIMGKYKNDTWFKVNVINSKAGWMHQSLVNEVIKQDELKKDYTTEPIRVTRAEYEAKYGVPVPTEVETKVEAEKVSLWKKIISWFGF